MLSAESAVAVAQSAGWKCSHNPTESVLIATNNQSSIHTATASRRGWYSRKLLCWGARRIPDHAKVCHVLQSLAHAVRIAVAVVLTCFENCIGLLTESA